MIGKKKEKNNKIIDVQEIVFSELKRLDSNSINSNNTKESKLELSRATGIYNMANVFLKSIRTNIDIIDLANKNGQTYEDLLKELGA